MKTCRLLPRWVFVSCWLCLLGSALSLHAQIIDPPIDPLPRDLVSIAAVDAEGAEPERIPPGMLRPTLLNPLVFAISRVGPIDFDLPVFYRLSGTAGNGSDYDALPSMITIPKGATSVSLTVVPLDDELAEVTETVVVALEYPICPAIFPPPRECYLLGETSVAQGIVLDNGAVVDVFPPKVSVIASDAVATEPRTPLPNERLLLDRGQFRISRTGSTTQALRVFYSLSGSALNGSDYQALRSAIVIPEGATSIDVDVVPINDGVLEPTETVVLTLVDPLTLPEPSDVTVPEIDPLGVLGASYSLGAPAAAKIELVDNGEGKPVELPVVSIRTLDAESAEPSADSPDIVRIDKASVLISRTEPFDAPLTVMYRLGGTAVNGTDYQRLSYTATIPAGSKSTVVEIVPLFDRIPESVESVVVTLVRWPSFTPVDPPVLTPSYQLGADFVAEALIRDNGLVLENRPPKADIVSPTSGSGFEAPASFDIVVQTADADGYVPWVEFFAGKEKIGDSRIDFIKAPEPGTLITHTFRWENVSEGSYVITSVAHDNGGATTLTAEISVRVVSKTGRNIVSVQATDAEGAEPNPVAPGMGMPIRLDPLVFTVSRAGDLTFPLTVFYHLEGSAKNGIDYDKLPGLIEIPAGEKSIELTVSPIDDDLVEGPETVAVVIDPPICLAVAKPLPGCYLVGTEAGAKGVILDNDPNASLRPTVTIMARDAIATEGPSVWATPTATFVIRRQGPLEDELTVGLKIGGSATPGKDYQSFPEKVVIPAGIGSVPLVILPIDDQELERIETVLVELLPAESGLAKPGLGWPAYKLGRPAQAAVIILDNDQPRPPCRLLPDGRFHLCLPGERGLTYRLEVSPDLTEWSDLGLVSAEDGAVHYVDPGFESGSRRFYRLQPLSLDSAETKE